MRPTFLSRVENIVVLTLPVAGYSCEHCAPEDESGHVGGPAQMKGPAGTSRLPIGPKKSCNSRPGPFRRIAFYLDFSEVRVLSGGIVYGFGAAVLSASAEQTFALSRYDFARSLIPAIGSESGEECEVHFRILQNCIVVYPSLRRAAYLAPWVG
jgi:hypothetical protein